MSNICKRASVKMGALGLGSNLLFPVDMYGNILGSVIVSAYILSDDKSKFDIPQIKRTWNRLKQNPNKIKFGLDDENFIVKTLELFNLEKPESFPIAFVQGDVNALFAPYVDGKVLPLREDGFMALTLRKGKIYPIDWSETE